MCFMVLDFFNTLAQEYNSFSGEALNSIGVYYKMLQKILILLLQKHRYALTLKNDHLFKVFSLENENVFLGF